MTPEHDRRAGTPNSGEPMHPEVLAAYAYVGTAVATADVNAYGSPAWYGWALREAFLAGCTHAQPVPLTRERINSLLLDSAQDSDEMHDFARDVERVILGGTP